MDEHHTNPGTRMRSGVSARADTFTGASMSAAGGSGTVVALFHERNHAEAAIADLERAGFRDDQIGFASHPDSVAARSAGASSDSDAASGSGAVRSSGGVTTDTGPGSGALSGAVTGGAIGGVLGALASLALPGVGPIVAAGILGPLLGGLAAGAGVGAIGGGLVGGLVTTGVPEEDAHYYDAQFRAGRSLVTVQARDRAAEARAILQHYGGHHRTTTPSSSAET